MAEFINTIDLLGDEETLDALLDGSITEFNDDVLTMIHNNSFTETKLISVNLPNVTNIFGNAFYRCFNLEKVDLGSVTNIYNYAFYSVNKLKTLIIRTNSICSIGGTNLNKICNIYVPKNLVDSYKADSVWSAWASQIKAIEDYPDICG